MTIYLVTDGGYSDYRVLGVYSTEEKAKYAKRLYMAGNDVEVFEVDALPEHPPGMLLWHVVMNKEGDAIEAYQESAGSRLFGGPWRPSGPETVLFRIWADGVQHAIKIANERRLALIASGQWTTNWKTWEKMQKEVQK